MPLTRNYNPQSIIYFQEDRGDEIFILQKGSVVLVSTPIGEQKEQRESIKIGGFFGVKSALGHYPREETAQAAAHTTLIAFKQEEFKKYILGNTRLILQMMQVFSQELRETHQRVRSILNADQEKNPAFELLSTGESFYKNHNLTHAAYAFRCYLNYYKNGNNRKRAEEFLNRIEKGATWPPECEAPLSEAEDRNEDEIENTVEKN